jgi:hypothetical protein
MKAEACRPKAEAGFGIKTCAKNNKAGAGANLKDRSALHNPDRKRRPRRDAAAGTGDFRL